MADKFEDLRNYAAVVEHGGVIAAAAALGIAKSAVSRRLGELEARLGVSLVERTTRRFELTALGRDYYAKAIAILSSLDALDAGIGDSSTVARVKVLSGPTLIAHLVAPALASFLIGDQAVSIELVAMMEVPRQLENDAVMITADGARAGRGLTSTALATTRHVVCAAPSYLNEQGTPANLLKLRDHEAIVVAGDKGGWAFPGGTARSPSTRLSVPDAESALAAAIGGAGLAHLPDFLVSQAVSRGELQTLLEDVPATNWQIVAMHRPDCEPSVRRLVDHLVGSLRNRG